MKVNGNDISRRKILGSLGAIGGAAALGGASTMAFFSDEETLANNQLVAGELDLKVDWEEHYSDWSDDESAGLDDAVAMTDGDPANVPDGYVGLPDPTEPLIAVSSNDLSTFMDNTAVEAYPDPNDDGVQDSFAGSPGETTEAGVGYICEDGADTPEDLDPTGGTGTGLRTETLASDAARGEATVDDNGDPLPVIDIADVKPGDFGELTLSYHLCDNPGYVYLQAANVQSSENGYTEPERKDDDESGDADGDGEDDTTELLDEIQTTWWYDEDGDNVLDTDGGGGAAEEVDLMIAFDTSGSMDDEDGKLPSAKDGAKTLVDSVGAGVDVGLVDFDSSASVVESLGSSKSSIKSTIDSFSAFGGTDVGSGINEAQDELTNNGRSSARNVMVLLTNGQSSSGRSEATNAKDARTTIYGIAYGSGADENLIEDISSPPKTDDGSITSADRFAFAGGQADIGTIFGDIGGRITGGGERVFFRGSLRESLNLLSTDDGFLLDSDPSTEEPDPFEPSTTNYIGFAWYLPVNHANEIQTDSVGFDLALYTEQARHNDPTMGNT
jgi:predicted ribosomally synthesized peptide with SipW-like signal peptide